MGMKCGTVEIKQHPNDPSEVWLVMEVTSHALVKMDYRDANQFRHHLDEVAHQHYLKIMRMEWEKFSPGSNPLQLAGRIIAICMRPTMPTRREPWWTSPKE